jgi:hypothetical protein
MVSRETKLAYELSGEGRVSILPVRLAYSGALPMDLGAYLDPIQQTLWTDNIPFEDICKKILEAIQAPLPAYAMPPAEPSQAELQTLARTIDQKGDLCRLPIPGLRPGR